MSKKNIQLIALLCLCVLFCGSLGGFYLHRHPYLISETFNRAPMPILMYHHLVEDGQDCNEMTVTVSRMDNDLQWLSDHGYTPVLPRELISGEPLPDKPVLITFDDGYRSNYELLYPLLQKHNAKVVISVMVYLPAHAADDFITWAMCREMTESGLVEIGSHTYLMHNLDGRGGNYVPGGINGIQRDPAESDEEFDQRVLDDLRLSKQLIEENVGAPAVFFAYPFGYAEPDALNTVHELFPVSVVTRRGLADLTKPLQEMPRYTITMNTSLEKLLKSA